MADRVAVYVRARPLLKEELRGRNCIELDSISNNNNHRNGNIYIGNKKFGPFEAIFSQESSQNDIYEQCVRTLVDGVFEGFNGTVFAYGQTGSGKTHSIMGSFSALEEEEGIIPRAIKDLFAKLDKSIKKGSMCSVKVSMMVSN